MRSALRPGHKAITGVLHLGRLLGQEGFAGVGALTAAALDDARALEAGGVDALLVENFADASPGPFVDAATVACLARVCAAVRAATALPVGVNVLPNDYRAAFALARACGLDFVQLDVLVDAVRTDYSYSDAPPFEVRVDLADLAAVRARLGAQGVPLWGTVHPKHYALLEATALEAQAVAAVQAGAQAVVVTGAATGQAPDAGRVARVRRALGQDVPLVVGSGLDASNAAALLEHADGAIVGTALRAPGLGPVVVEQVRAVVAAARAVRVHSPR
ncbi:MAG: phosphorybosylanthranilate isomerase [Planctomycetes bacterium]|nr:phosphorybosylanthranilate isomerase [Planctomycetota bacterium]